MQLYKQMFVTSVRVIIYNTDLQLMIQGIIICTFLSGAIRTQAAPSEISCKYYTSIEVQSGDTLWSIASDHITEEYRDMNAYIDEVCSINKISQDEIHAGQYLTIPYYSSIAVAGN